MKEFYITSLATLIVASFIFTFFVCYITGHELAFVHMLEHNEIIPWYTAVYNEYIK